MPGITKVSKEMIVQCALRITRQEGIEKVNARRIGKELKCSLQPVYYYFGTMDTLREEVIKAANEVYNQFIEKSKEAPEKRFKSVGTYYILFANQEKELFKLLFMRHAHYQSEAMNQIDDNNEYIWHELCSTYGLSLEQAKKLHFETWIATHGIATMIATGFMSFTTNQISDYLSDVFIGLLKKYKGE